MKMKTTASPSSLYITTAPLLSLHDVANQTELASLTETSGLDFQSKNETISYT